MTYTVLDIGAGDKKFARNLIKQNKQIEMLVLCGEPGYILRIPGFWEEFILGDSWDRATYFRNLFRRPISKGKVASFLREGKRGVHFIEAAYESFNLPDSSLDLVTLNSPHPLCPPGVKMKEELLRCLKPGGLFFSSFPLYDTAKVPESFIEIAEGGWSHPGSVVRLKEDSFPDLPFRAFPQSPVLESNIRTHQRNRHMGNIVGYIYSNGITPGWQVWRKPR